MGIGFVAAAVLGSIVYLTDGRTKPMRPEDDLLPTLFYEPVPYGYMAGCTNGAMTYAPDTISTIKMTCTNPVGSRSFVNGCPYGQKLTTTPLNDGTDLIKLTCSAR